MTISKANISQLDSIFKIIKDCRMAMNNDGIFQWTANYPTIEIISNDIQMEYMYCLIVNDIIIGIINIGDIQELEYKSVNWIYNEDKILTIHRLADQPQFQKQGFAKKLMDFAENYAILNGYTSIRLDAYSGNERVLRFYENRNYMKRGEVYFTGRKLPFYCYEKLIE